MPKEYTCTCYKCGREYKKVMEPEEAERLFSNYEPTDWECPECEEWEQKAADYYADQAHEALIARHIN